MKKLLSICCMCLLLGACEVDISQPLTFYSEETTIVWAENGPVDCYDDLIIIWDDGVEGDLRIYPKAMRVTVHNEYGDYEFNSCSTLDLNAQSVSLDCSNESGLLIGTFALNCRN